VGRFQPFHLGHLFAVKHILKDVERLVVVVGSSQKSHEPRHPFTLGERVSMIIASLEEEGIPASRYIIIPVPDVEYHPTWVSLVEFSCPTFSAVYSNDSLTMRLMKEAGYRVREVPLQDRESLSGTEIRRRIAAGERWSHLVPRAVYAYVKSIQGDERIRELSGSETP